MTLRIAIIGAAGYVGLELSASLKRAGHEVVGITRANGNFLLDRIGVPVESPAHPERVGRVDVVINLAYPNKGSNLTYGAQNEELARTIAILAGADARVIHTSTQAVFGFELDSPIVAGPVARRHDQVYVESKIELELLLQKVLAGRDLHIVRLGNVWGPASPTWTVALVDKILFGDPVGVVNRDGFCNATDVGNVASYIGFLAGLSERGDNTRFHHLAEFSELRWSFWVERVATALGFDPVYADSLPQAPAGFAAEIRGAVAASSPFAVAKGLYTSRTTGSYLRAIAKKLPSGPLTKLKTAKRGGAVVRGDRFAADREFLSIISSRTQFRSVLDVRWSPALDAEASWRRVETWMADVGYVTPAAGKL